MKVTSSQIRMSMLIVACTVFGCTFPAARVFAQNATETPGQALNPKLASKVRLELGSTTVYRFLASLSEQTGLTIKAEDYLRERIIIVQLTDISAEAALNDISELNDWAWSETSPNHIMVEPKKLHVPVSPNAIPRFIQAAIPRDIRTYLGIPTPSEDMAIIGPGGDNNLAFRGGRAFGTLMRTIPLDQAGFLTSLPPEIRTGESIPYNKLTPVQRSRLLVALVFPAFQETSNQLLRSNAVPQVSNVADAVLKLSGKLIDVRMLVHDATGDTMIGFGGQLP